MKPSKLLQKFLSTGNKPANQREASALLDESRSILVSKLPSTAIHIQNLTEGDIEGILAGGREGIMDRAAAVHRAAQSKPAAKPDRIYELCAVIKDQAAQARKPLPAAKKAAAPKGRPDKRVGALPLAQWSFGHLASAAQAGDQLALNELTARGFSQTSNNTFSKLPS